MTPRRVGIFGGSFNPVHLGHTALARYIAASGLVDEVWLTLSPSNPLKHIGMESTGHRLEMLRIATRNLPEVAVCDIELSMPRPSYTVDTLDRLSSENPDCRFTLITGADNLAVFDQWRDYRRIISRYGLIVYPRPGYDKESLMADDNIVYLDNAPLYDVSSTNVRRAILDSDMPNNYLDSDVYNYIMHHQLYRHHHE